MKLPIEVKKKLDIIKEKGITVVVGFIISEMKYKVVMGEDKQEFITDKDFYEYIDKKLKEVLND